MPDDPRDEFERLTCEAISASFPRAGRPPRTVPLVIGPPVGEEPPPYRVATPAELDALRRAARRRLPGTRLSDVADVGRRYREAAAGRPGDLPIFRPVRPLPDELIAERAEARDRKLRKPTRKVEV